MSAASDDRSKLTIKCLDWKPLRRNTLLGFCAVRVVELHLVIHEVSVHEKNGIFWASPPSKPWFKDGAFVTGDDGRTKFSPIFEFDNKAVRDGFSAAVIAAVRTYRPDALDEETAA